MGAEVPFLADRGMPRISDAVRCFPAPPSVHVEVKVIIAVNGAFAGGSGLLGVCASYILAPYKRPRARKTSRKTTN